MDTVESCVSFQVFLDLSSRRLNAACWGNVVEAPRNSESDFFVALSRTSESVRPSGRARRQRCCLLLKPTHTIASSLLFCSLSSLGSRSLLTRCCPLCATCAQLSPLVMPAATYDASMSTPALNRVLSTMGVSKTDFCSQRGLEYQALALASPSAIEKFCVATKNESATNGGGKRLVRRGTIANGKLDGTAIANYWNLEKAPGKHASGGLAMA